MTLTFMLCKSLKDPQLHITRCIKYPSLMDRTMSEDDSVILDDDCLVTTEDIEKTIAEITGSLEGSGSAPMFDDDDHKTCAGCGDRIEDKYLLHTNNKFWHARCLKCTCCQASLENLGTCFSKSGMILCRNDYVRLFQNSGVCSNCSQNIPCNEMVIKAQEKAYHMACFKCVHCQNILKTGEKYAVVDDNILCENDYMKLVRSQGFTSPPRKSSALYNRIIV